MVGREINPYLPNDILLNILIRLPVQNVMRCRCVCRGWRDLTSTEQFLGIHLHEQVTDPSILVDAQGEYPVRDRYFIHSWWEPTETRSKPEMLSNKLSQYHVRLSHGGLIVLRQRFSLREWIILNPINNDSLRIKFVGDIVHRWKDYNVYGVFFHPLLNEYCTLWGDYGSKLAKFKLLVMGSMPYYSDIGNPLGEKPRHISTFPILVNGHLYWMARPQAGDTHYDIIQFDLKSGEFVLTPSPVPTESFFCCSIGILDIDGLVSVVKTSDEDKTFTVWRLEDPSQKIWTSSSYSISTQGPLYLGNRRLLPIVFRKGEILFGSYLKVFVYNLKSETIRPFQRANFGYDDVFFPHVMTLASLRNSKSRIKASETMEETSGGRIQIIREQLNRTQTQENSGC